MKAKIPMNLALTPAEEARLKDRARARGTTPEALVRQAMDQVIDSAPESESHKAESDKQVAGARPISQVIADIMKDAPSQELRKLPRDGASEHDHYIYGWPKKN